MKSGINSLLLKSSVILSLAIALYIVFQLVISFYTGKSINKNLEINSLQRIFWEINYNSAEIESIFLNFNLGYLPSMNKIFNLFKENEDKFEKLRQNKFLKNQSLTKLVAIHHNLKDKVLRYKSVDSKSTYKSIFLKEITELFFISRLLSNKISEELKEQYIINSNQVSNVTLINIISLFILTISGVFIIYYLFKVKNIISEKVILLNETIFKFKINSNKQTEQIVDYKEEDEFAPVFATFKKMIKTIQQQHDFLKQSEEKFRDLYQNHPNALLLYDDDFNLRDCNETALTMFKCTTKEDLFDLFKYYKQDSFTSDQKQCFLSKLKEVLETKKRNTFECSFFKKDGSEFLSDNVVLVQTINGQVFLQHTIRDITQIRKNEDKQIQSQKMESIGTLAGGIAHDFNNVLSGIIGSLSILNLKIENNSCNKEILEKYLQTIEVSAERAKNMVSSLLLISRKQEMNFKKENLVKAISNVVELAKNSFDKSITIDFKADFETAGIYADIHKLEQVFLNVMINAAHSMTIMRSKNEKWGGNLKVRLQKISSSTFKHCLKDFCWQITFADQGVGISKELKEKIFTPFFTTKEKGQGTGLGLSMAYNIISKHKGSIDVYSELTKGTNFTILLPAYEEEDSEEESSKIEYSIASLTGTGKILLIDDEEIMRTMGTEILKECGYQIETAIDGLDGLLKLEKSGKPDLIILDMVMPKLSGKETFYAIRKIYPDLKILMSSGFKEDERVQEVLEAGANGFIQKPYALQNLALAVKKIMEENNR